MHDRSAPSQLEPFDFAVDDDFVVSEPLVELAADELSLLPGDVDAVLPGEDDDMPPVPDGDDDAVLLLSVEPIIEPGLPGVTIVVLVLSRVVSLVVDGALARDG